MNEVNAQQLVGMITAISAAVNAGSDELNRLDAALGDGDHGTSLSAAFAEAAMRAAAVEQPTPSSVLNATAQALMNRMGGASGALYGTLFLRAGAAVKDKTLLSHDDLKAMWRAGLDGVLQRGKAQVGDKTMVDALQPAAAAFVEGSDMANSFERAALAAQKGAQATEGLIAKHGRARFVGERGIGHVDAGARSIAIMFNAMYEYWKDSQHGET